MKLLVTADWHLNATLVGADRFPEILDAVKDVVRIGLDREVDVFLNAGDLWDGRTSLSRGSQLAEHLVRGLAPLARAGIPGLVIGGNHDPKSFFRMAESFLQMAESGAGRARSFRFVTEPRIVHMKARSGGTLQVVCVPDLPQDVIAHRAGVDLAAVEADVATRKRAVSDAIGAMIQQLVQSEAFRADLPSVLLLHHTVEGASYVPVTEQGDGFQHDWAKDVVIRQGQIPNVFQFGAFGHIHTPQEVKGLPFPAYYPGPLARLSVGEREVDPAVLIVTLGDSGVEVERVPIPARPIYRIEIAPEDLPAVDLPEDAWVKFIVNNDGTASSLDLKNEIARRWPNHLPVVFKGKSLFIRPKNARLEEWKNSAGGAGEFNPLDVHATTEAYLRERFRGRDDLDDLLAMGRILVDRAEATHHGEGTVQIPQEAE